MFCIFPSCVKTAVIIPKSVSYDDPLNFRPIFLLPTPFTLIEEIKNKCKSFLKDNHISASQFRFQEFLSTNNVIFFFLGNLYLGLNDGEFAAAVLRNFFKVLIALITSDWRKN